VSFTAAIVIGFINSTDMIDSNLTSDESSGHYNDVYLFVVSYQRFYGVKIANAVVAFEITYERHVSSL